MRREGKTSYHLGAGIEASRRGQELSYYHRDEQLSTAFITGDQSEIQNSYQYNAFGTLLASTEQSPNRIRYTGQQYDDLTGQYYLRARYYNPVLGRFMQEDVYQGDGLNLYAYCGNNPEAYCDLSGYSRRNNDYKLRQICSGDDFNEDDWDDLLDDNAANSRMGRQIGNTPRDNQSQNEQFEAVLNALGIHDKKRRNQLHHAVSHQGMGFAEMLKFAREFFGME